MNAPTEVKKREHYPMFDVLRLVLASSVVAIHLTAWAGYNHGNGWDFVLVPVPCFLALSGFMVLASRQGSANGFHFWQKRILRIAPAFLVALGLVAVLFGWAFVWPTLRLWASAGISYGGSRDGALWSLSCEEVLYLLMAFLWLVGCYRSKAAIWLLFAISTALLFFPQFVMARTAPPEVARLTMLPSAFFMGNLFFLYKDQWIVHAKWFLVPLLIALAAQRWLIWQDFGPHSFPAGPVRLLAACLTCLMAGTLYRGKAWLKADLSYGIYVYHSPILLKMSGQPGAGAFLWILGPVVVLLVSFTSFYLIEKPALRLKNWRPKALPLSAPVPQET